MSATVWDVMVLDAGINVVVELVASKHRHKQRHTGQLGSTQPPILSEGPVDTSVIVWDVIVLDAGINAIVELVASKHTDKHRETHRSIRVNSASYPQ